MKVDCNKCGSSLEVGGTTRFVTCVECTARLAVQRSGSAIYTEVLEGSPVDRTATSGAALASSGVEGASEIPSLPAPVPGTDSEAFLRLIVGVLLVGSDLYWWFTDPGLQTLNVRIGLLAAGAWLLLSGAWRGIVSTRARLRAHRQHEQVVLEIRRSLAPRSAPVDPPT